MPDVTYWNVPYTDQQIEDALTYSAPRIGTNNTWERWSITQGEWEDTEVSVLPIPPHDPYIGANLDWYVWDSTTEQYVDSGVVAGHPAYDGSVQEVTS